MRIACYIATVNIVSAIWRECIGDIHINTFGAIPLDMLIAAKLLDMSYVVHRIFSVLLCINVLKSNWSKAKILLVIVIGIIIWILFTNILVTYNFNKFIDNVY